MGAKILIAIPAYNEANNLKMSISKLKNSLKTITENYEIIIAEDGSTYRTKELAEDFSKRDAKIAHLHSDKRLGMGKALNRAFKSSNGKILIYMDVDLATDLKHLKELIESIEKGAQFATGSRMLKNSDTKRPLKREIMSRGYNLLVRLSFGSPIRDMQC